MKFYRFKSNPHTVVVEVTKPGDGRRFVKPIWGRLFEAGSSEAGAFMYLYDKNNLIPLSLEEEDEIVKKREAAGLVPFWIYPPETQAVLSKIRTESEKNT